MNIGSLYLVKISFWLLFPTKETAVTAAAVVGESAGAASHGPLSAAYWSQEYNCEVTYFSPDSIIVFLEEDGEYKKVLTSDGKIGWTCFDGSYKSCFEEMKA